MSDFKYTHGASFEPNYVKTPETDRAPYSDKRTITARWQGNPAQEDTASWEAPRNAVEVSIIHHKSTKVYSVTATAVTADHNSTRFDLMNDLTRITTIPCARYSRKELDRIATEVFAAFPGNLPPGSNAAKVFERITAEATGTAEESVTTEVSANLPAFELA